MNLGWMYQYGLDITKGREGGRSRALAKEGQKPLLGPTLAEYSLGVETGPTGPFVLQLLLD